MNLETFEQLIIQAYSCMDIEPLCTIPQETIISYDYCDEYIKKVEKQFKKLKTEGIDKIKIVPSICKYCYPESNAFKLLNNQGNFIIRYVIYQKGTHHFCVEECTNKPLPKQEGGLPF